MATYYVDPVSGLDTNPGTEAEPKLTIAAGVPLCTVKGDVLRLRNTGSHVWTVQTNGTPLVAGTIGTSLVDYGVLIEGVDGDNNSATVTIAATGADGNRSLVRINHNTGWLIWRNILFDSSAKFADSATYEVCEHHDAGSPDPGPVLFQGCGFVSGATTVRPSGSRLPIVITAGPGAVASDVAYFDRCAFQNPPANMLASGFGGRKAAFDDCVFITDSAALGVQIFGLGSGVSASNNLRFKNCTVYWNLGAFAVNNLLGYDAGNGTDVGTVDVYNNLFFIDATVVASIILVNGVGSSATVTNAGTIDYNVFLGGPGVTGVGDLSANGPYNDPWGLPQAFQTNDTVAYSQDEALIFKAPSSTYVWDPLGNGATLTLLKDLRLIAHQTAGLAGARPGALPLPETDFAVTVTTDNTAPEPGDTETITVTITNTGAPSNSVVVTSAIPTGVTLTSVTPTHGSYDSGTGLWSIGSMLDTESASLVFVVMIDSDQSGQTIEWSATYTNSDTDDTDSTNDSDSVSMAVLLPPGEDPTVTPFLDVEPIFAPVLLAEINAMVRTKRNRVTHHELRRDIERHKWREYTARRIALAASQILQVTSSIERISHVLLEATGDIQVSVSNDGTDVYFPNVQQLALLNADLTTLKLSNTGSASVDVLLVVID